MKITTKLQMLFIIAIIFAVVSCKQSDTNKETEAIDSTSVTTEGQDMNTTADTIAEPTNGTTTDTIQGNGQEPVDNNGNPQR